MSQKYILSLGLEGNVICPVYLRGIDHKGKTRNARYITTDLKDAEIASNRFFLRKKESLNGVRVGVATYNDGKPGIFVHVCGEETPDFFEFKDIRLPSL